MDKITKLNEFMREDEILEVLANSSEVADMDLKRIISQLIADGISSEKIWEYIMSHDGED